MSTMDQSTAEQVPVRRVMTGRVLGIVPSAPLEIALRMMVEAGVRHLPVVADGRCLGLLYESDVLWRLWSTVAAERPLSSAVARRTAPTVRASDTVHTAVLRMAETGSDAVLVLEGGRLVGILTTTDVLRLLATG